MKGDKAAANAAFTRVRNEAAKLIADQPDYAEALCVLGMADACSWATKRTQFAKVAALSSCVPVSKNAIEGALLIRYLAVVYAWTGEKDLALRAIR